MGGVISVLGYLFLVAFSLIFIPQIIFYLIYVFYWLKSRRFVEPEVAEEYSGKVSFIIPVRREPLEYLENAVTYIGSLNIPDYEIIIVSDDDEETGRRLFQKASELRRRGLRVWVIWRREPRGYRTGALNTGLFASSGDYIYVMDVDTRFDKCLLGKAIALLKTSSDTAGVVGRWKPLNKESRLPEAIAASMDFVVNAIYKGRSAMGLSVFPLGTGTLFDKHLLQRELGGWDEERIQDDMEIGTRLMGRGLKVAYVESCGVYVENPSSFRAFRIQQSRWAYGSVDAFLSRCREILRSKQKLIGKIEASIFLLQYVPAALAFTGTLVLASTVFFTPPSSVTITPQYNLGIRIFLLWLIAEATYGYVMHKEIRKSMSTWRALVNQGRIAAVTVAITPYVTYFVLRALLRRRMTYKRTPKGVMQLTEIGDKLRIPVELLFGLFFAFAGVFSLMKGLFIPGMWLVLYGSGFLYVVLRWPRDVFLG